MTLAMATILTVTAADSQDGDFVDLDVSLWAWLGLLIAIVILLAIDLFRHRDDHEPSQREAALESSFWVLCGLSFSAVIWAAYGGAAFLEYLSGYLIEKSLSVDNVFVWSLLFSTMAVPLKYQHRVLFWGIFGALVMRAIFIGLGVEIISRYWWVLLLFGLILVVSGIRMLLHKDEPLEDQSVMGMSLIRRIIPVSDNLDGHNFFTRVNGARVATPLFVALIVVELSDIVFAVDSVPAIMSLSREPFLIFSSNAFAILGLRAMYFFLANAKDQFKYLTPALGVVLIFVGSKMVISHWYHVPTLLSLTVIITVLVLAVSASLISDAKKPELKDS